MNNLLEKTEKNQMPNKRLLGVNKPVKETETKWRFIMNQLKPYKYKGVK